MGQFHTFLGVRGRDVEDLLLNSQAENEFGLDLPDNLPGALYKALSTFVLERDLSKIESRPL